MIFYPTEPRINKDQFKKQDWSNSVYASDATDLKEVLPLNMSEPQGRGVTIRAYGDADHAGDSVIGRL